MSLITGTITSANPSADLYTPLAAALTTAGLTLVDTVVISTRTHKIWKNAAANNPAALDYYLDIAYATTGAGNLWIIPCEFYDPATDLAYRMPMGLNGGGTLEGTYYTIYGATGQSLENTNWAVRAGNATALCLQTQTSAFGYWISIRAERITGFTTVAPSALLYVGLYEPEPLYATNAGAALFPLVTASLDGSGGASGGNSAGAAAALNRLPKYTGSAGFGAAGTGDFIPLIQGAYAPGIYGLPVLAAGGSVILGVYVASPIRIFSGQGANSSGNSKTAPLGYLYDVATIAVANTVTRGDTVTIGSDSWVLGAPTLSTGSGYYATALRP